MKSIVKYWENFKMLSLLLFWVFTVCVGDITKNDQQEQLRRKKHRQNVFSHNKNSLLIIQSQFKTRDHTPKLKSKLQIWYETNFQAILKKQEKFFLIFTVA